MARPTKEKMHLYDKRSELVWALDHQGYNGEEIAVIFSVDRSTIKRIIAKMPRDWRPKWVKVS